MRKIILFTVMFFLFSVCSLAGPILNPYTGKFDFIQTISETDDDPMLQVCRILKFQNGQVTDNGDGSCSIAGADLSGYVPYSGATGNVDLGSYSIFATNLAISNWNTAFGWGDHASAGYLTSESDPIFLAWQASYDNHANWDLAYGWGDHSLAGYLTSISGLNISLLTNDSGYISTESDPTIDLSKLQSLVSNDFHNLGGIDDTQPDSTDLDNAFCSTDGKILGRSGGSWQCLDPSGGSPGGSDGYVQYNDGGSFGGNSSFVFDDVNGFVGIGNSSPAYRLDLLSSSDDVTLYLKNTAITGSYYRFAIDTYAVTDKAFGTTINGGSTGAFVFYGDGKMEWGSGSSSRDTNLYRASSNKLVTDDWLGTGGATPEGSGHFYTPSSGGIGSTALFERGDNSSDLIYASGRVLATKTTNMGDGFGVLYGYSIRDDAGTINQIGYIGARRSGADNSGDLIFYNVNSGSASNTMIIETDGDLVVPAVYSEDLAGTSPRAVYVKSDGTLGYDSSTITAKENVREYEDSGWIYLLSPKLYDRKNKLGKDEVGLIAEEVDLVVGHNPELISYQVNRVETPIEGSEIGEVKVTYEETNIPQTVNYQRLIVPLLKEVQNLKKEIDELKESIKSNEKVESLQ